jgi:hypothetical protein
MRQAARWRCWTAIALSVCCCFLSVACAETSTNPRNDGGPPHFFTWISSASVGATTPQEAYALSAHFTPCIMPDGETTSPDQSVTWLLSGPRAGVAYARATCRGAVHGDYVYRCILEVVKGTVQGRHDAWDVDHFEWRLPLPPTAFPPTPTVAPFAPSVADLLPADSYRDSGPGRTSPLAGPSVNTPVFLAWRAWIALTPRDYVLGLVADSGGLPGWVTEANGMATVVTPRSYGAVFFSGTGSAHEIEALAARVLPAAEEALGGPPPPTPTPAPTSTSEMGGGR